MSAPRQLETGVAVQGTVLSATLDLPAEQPWGGVVALHGASCGERDYFLYRHLGLLLTRHGLAVLRFDRRPRAGADVPLPTQAADAGAAVAQLRHLVGGVPVALWGFSQGAWAAALTAATYPDLAAALVLVSGSGVSPAAQMRYGSAEQLRRRGYAPGDLADLAELRAAYEAQQRGELDRDAAQAVVDRYAGRPWFDLVHVPRRLPDRPGAWADMDYDPAPVLAAVRCPVLACYGDLDEWVPIEDSLAAWRRAATGALDLELHRLAGCDHHPTLHEGRDLDAVSPQYADLLASWLPARLQAAR